MVPGSMCSSLNKAVVEHHARKKKLTKPDQKTKAIEQGSEEEERREPASPPCLRHEIDPTYMGEPEASPRKKTPEDCAND